MILLNSWIFWLEEIHLTCLLVRASLYRTWQGMFNLWEVFSWESAVFECAETTCRSSRPEVFFQKGVSETSQNSQENTCVRVSFLMKLQAEARSAQDNSWLQWSRIGLTWPFDNKFFMTVFWSAKSPKLSDKLHIQKKDKRCKKRESLEFIDP